MFGNTLKTVLITLFAYSCALMLFSAIDRNIAFMVMASTAITYILNWGFKFKSGSKYHQPKTKSVMEMIEDDPYGDNDE